jgi:enoyl-[acyl-carrier protein] reductase I
MDFLQLQGKNVLVLGVANRRSVAYAAAQSLREAGANLLFVVKDQEVREATERLLGDAPVFVCDVEDEAQIRSLATSIRQEGVRLHGLVHSIAFARYSHGFGPFHETVKEDFLQAVDISCYSLIAVCRELRTALEEDASVVTVSISTTRMAAQNYGFMAPVKAALDSSVVFLAKSLGDGTRIRVNAVGAGLLKTSASAGIPGYVDSYLYAEQVIPRKQVLETREVGDTIAFLISPRSSGINAQTVVVDAGMSINYFDRPLVRAVVEHTDHTRGR